jgi:putative membrane protein
VIGLLFLFSLLFGNFPPSSGVPAQIYLRFEACLESKGAWMSAPTLPIPYCGLPPSPETLWSRWNLDPILISALVLLAGLYALGAWRAHEPGRAMPTWRRASFCIGWAITAAALISPLCPLSVSLFAARIGQHMVLVLIGAPLVAAGRPFATVSNLWRTSELGRDSNAAAPICAAALFAVLLWFWHAPAPYAETFRSTFVYWSMHITLYGTALWLWSSLIDAPAEKVFHTILAGLISSLQMGFLGAVITFAPRPLYTPHLLTTAPWNLTPLQDQQLGGALMWVPGGAVFLTIAMLVLWRDLMRSDLPENSMPAKMVSR